MGDTEKMSMTSQEIIQEEEIRDGLVAKDKGAGRDLTTYQKNYIVEAGAGAGKTTILVERIVNQLIETDVTPLQLVAITFTKKATQEMQERLSALVLKRLQQESDPIRKEKIQGIFDQLGQMQVSTIHGFCQTMLCAMPFETVLGLDWTLSEPDTRNARAFFEKKLAEGHGLVAAAQKRHLEDWKLFSTFEKFCADAHMVPQYTDVTSSTYTDCRTSLLEMVGEPTNWIEIVNNKRITTQDTAYHRGLSPFAGLSDGDQYLLHPDFLALVKQVNPTEEDCLRFAEFLNGSLRGIFRPYNSQARRVIEQLQGVGDDETAVQYRDLLMAAKGYVKLQNTANGKRIKEKIGHLIHCELTPHLVDLARQYVVRKVEEGRADYNDLLRYTRDLLRDSVVARDYFRDRYRVIYVDEFQDTDPLQAELLFYLASSDDAASFPADWRQCQLRPGSLFFTGDPKQGIYRFRGADISIYNTVKEIFQRRKAGGGTEEVVNLQFNFRSDKSICDYVDKAFDANADKGSRLDGGTYQADYVSMEARNATQPGKKNFNGVYSYRVMGSDSGEQSINDPLQLSAFVHSMVEGGVVLQTKNGNHQVEYKDFLILTSKSRVQSYVQALAQRGIPVVASGEQRLDQVPAIEMGLAILRGLAHPDDSVAFVLVLTEYFSIKLSTIRRFLALADSRYISSLRMAESRAAVIEKLSTSLEDSRVAYLCQIGGELADLYHSAKGLPPMSTVERVFDYTFPLRCPQEEHQRENDYSLVVQMQNAIRSEAGGSLVEVYELACRCGETNVEYHLALQEEKNCVRIMNPHKAKGLEGKIVILANHGAGNISPTSHAQRTGVTTALHQAIFSRYQNTDTVYGTPLGWEGSGSGKKKIDGIKDIEKHYLSAERKRLIYVAATRAEYMLLIAYAPRVTTGGSLTDSCLWAPLRKASPADVLIDPANTSFTAEMGAAVKCLQSGEYTSKKTVTVPAKGKKVTQQADLPALQRAVSQSSRFSISPSRLDGDAPRPKPPVLSDDSDTATTLVVVDMDGATADADATQQAATGAPAYVAPYGAHWGTIIHRVLELAVRSGEYAPDALEGYSRQAIWETMHGTVLSKTQSGMLYGDTPATQQGEWLQKKVCEAVRFASDEKSAFRLLLTEGTTLPELAFFTATEGGEFYDHLQSHIKEKEGGIGKALDVQGFIDLAIHTSRGWIILDYKTNQQRPGQSDSKFDHHLAHQYRSQLDAYGKLLKEQTGEDTVACYLCAIHRGGRLIDLNNLPPEDRSGTPKIAPSIQSAPPTVTAISGGGTPLVQITGPYANTEQFTLYFAGAAVMLTNRKGEAVTTIKKCKTFVTAMQGWLATTYPDRDFTMKLENRGAEALMTMLIKKMRKNLTPQEQGDIAIYWETK